MVRLLLCLLFLSSVLAQFGVNFNNFQGGKDVAKPAEGGMKGDDKSCPEAEDEEAKRLGRQELNKRRTVHWFTRVLRDPPDWSLTAVLDADYVDHGANDGRRTGFVEGTKLNFVPGSGALQRFVRILAEDDMVFVHIYMPPAILGNLLTGEMIRWSDEGTMLERWQTIDFGLNINQYTQLNVSGFWGTTAEQTKKNKATAIAFMDAVNRKAMPIIETMLHDDFEGHPNSLDVQAGRINSITKTQFLDEVRGYPKAWVFTIAHLLAEGDLVAIQGQQTTNLTSCGSKAIPQQLPGDTELIVWLLRFDEGGSIIERFKLRFAFPFPPSPISMISNPSFPSPFPCSELAKL